MAIPNRDELLLMLRERLSPRRVLHTLGVESVAVCMAQRWDVDPALASRAALLHDLTKEDRDQLKLMREYAILPSIWEETVPNVYHALTGAALSRSLGFNEDIVAAVRWHATGHSDMTILEQVIFLADMAEPCRTVYPGLSEIRGLLYTDLNRALVSGLLHTLRFVRENERPEDRFTEEALKWAEDRLAKVSS